MRILISNSSQDPIYTQIYNQLKVSILKGELEQGEALPSIRSLAKDLHISVITTKRAYDELEKDGFLETIQGKGTFVAFRNMELVKEQKLRIIEELLNQVVCESKSLGLDYKEIIEMITILYGED